MKKNHYQLIGKGTEAILMDGKHFVMSAAVISFKDGEDSDPDNMVRNHPFIDIVIGGKTTSSMVPMIEFCVDPNSESERNLMLAAAYQGHARNMAMYVKHANGKCYSFAVGRFTTATKGGSICAVFRDVREISPDLYAAMRGPVNRDKPAPFGKFTKYVEQVNQAFAA